MIAVDNNALIVQHMLDRQADIDSLKANVREAQAEVERLTAENAELVRENHGLRGQIAAT